MRGWDGWVRRGSLASPSSALRAHNKGACHSRAEHSINGSDQARVLGRGGGHVATGKRAGMVEWMGGVGARACWGSDARNGVMERVGAEAEASQRT